MSKLSDEKIGAAVYASHVDITLSDAIALTRAIEAAVRAELAGQEPVADTSRSEAYDLIDHHLRNTLDDSDYADYSAALDMLYAAPVVQPQQEPVGKPHRWNDDGERCLDCGDKDWMADKYCSAAPVVQPEIEAKYNELLYAVANRYPCETRHETALRYLRAHEKSDGAAMAAEKEQA